MVDTVFMFNDLCAAAAAVCVDIIDGVGVCLYVFFFCVLPPPRSNYVLWLGVAIIGG